MCIFGNNCYASDELGIVFVEDMFYRFKFYAGVDIMV
jgi:hypothetical protein